MADRPILFSAPMIRALLAGHKTQTRRIQAEGVSMAGSIDHSSGKPIAIDATAWDRRWPVKTKYAIGDRLWVREAWSGRYEWREMTPSGRVASGSPLARETWYWADGEPTSGDWELPRPSIHMPRPFSRITLTVTDVRVQRLQDISEADAVAEGIERLKSGRGFYDPVANKGAVRLGQYFTSAIDAYAHLWDSINGEGAWDANPWVAAYTFTVQHRNIDQVAA